MDYGIYFGVIIEKMMPDIFIVINNKTENGYIDYFKYIKEYIYNSNKNRKMLLKLNHLHQILK